jgi:hypothetical protein
LVSSEDEERRSSGRAIVLLLDRIEELEAQLVRLTADRPSPPSGEPPQAHRHDPAPLEDTQPIGLRDRLRLATGRLHDR